VPAAVVDGNNHRAARLGGTGAPPHSSVNSGLLPEFSPSSSIPVADRATRIKLHSQPSVAPTPFIPPPSSRLYSDTKACLPHWRSAIAEWVAADPSKSRHCDRLLDHITHGLPIVPDPLPTDRHYPNTPLINQHADAVRKQLQQNLAMGAVEQCERRDIAAVHPLHCIVKPDKLRIVVDFSINLNDSLRAPHMHHVSSIDAAVAASRLGCYYSKLDIKDCFLSFAIRSGDEKYLGFCFEGKYYRFRRLPQGLNIAPELCELMLSVVSWQLTRRGVTHVRYCDDILIIGRDRASCDAMTNTAAEVLDLFGFVVAHKKTIRCQQSIEFLGVQFDSVLGTISCPPHRILELTRLLTTAAGHGTRHAVRFVLSLIGKLSFAAHVLPGARPFFRSLIDAVRGLPKRASLTLPSTVHDDLAYWQRHLSTWNGRQLWRHSTAPVVVATDASLTGWGGLVLSSPTPLPAPLTVGTGIAGVWCVNHPVTSHREIGWAELYAVLHLVALIAPAAPNSVIEFMVDNQSDVAIINRQSTRSPALLSILRAIYSIATDYNLSIIARHISGESNGLADALSRSLPLPSPGLSFVFHRCSCDVAVLPTTVPWSHPASKYSSDWRCDMVPRKPTVPSSATTSGSVLIPVGTTTPSFPRSSYAKPRFISARNERSSHSVTTCPHCRGGTRSPAMATYRATVDGTASDKGCTMYMVSSIRPSQLSLSRSLRFTDSYRSLTYDRSMLRATGVRRCLGSSGCYGLVNTPLPHLRPFTSESSMSQLPRRVFDLSFRSPRLLSLHTPSTSASATTISAPWRRMITTSPSSVDLVRLTNRSSLPHHTSLPLRSPSVLIHSANGSSSKRVELDYQSVRSLATAYAVVEQQLSSLPVLAKQLLRGMVAGDQPVTGDTSTIKHQSTWRLPSYYSSPPLAQLGLHRSLRPLPPRHHPPLPLPHRPSPFTIVSAWRGG
jgi:hypothetical protein